jgi:hypothetical protein
VYTFFFSFSACGDRGGATHFASRVVERERKKKGVAMEKRRNRLASSQPPCTHTGSWKRTSQLRASGSTVNIKSLSLSRSFFYSPLLRSTVRRTSAVCVFFSFSLGRFEILEETKNLIFVLCHR